MPKTNKRGKKRRRKGSGGRRGWSNQKLNKNVSLQISSDLHIILTCSLSSLSRSPPPNPHHLTLSHLILLSHFLTIVLRLSPFSVSPSPFHPHLNFPGLMFLQECPLPPRHTTGLKEGVWSWWEGCRFWPGFWEERRILGLCLSAPRLASLCDLWSLTSCLRIGGHGCGVEGDLKWVDGGGLCPKKKKNTKKKQGNKGKEIKWRASVVLNCAPILHCWLIQSPVWVMLYLRP